MGTGSKIVITFLAIAGFFFFGTLLTASGTSKSFVGFIALGLFFGLRALWRGSPQESNQKTEIKLKKDEPDDSSITLKK